MAGNLLSEWSLKSLELPVDNWWFLGFVLVVLMFAIWLIARLTTSVTDDIDPAEIDRQMLTAVRELHSQGELSPGEYRSIKGRLVKRMAHQNTPDGSKGSSAKELKSRQTEKLSPPTTEDPLGSSTPMPAPSDHSKGQVEEQNDTSENEADSET